METHLHRIQAQRHEIFVQLTCSSAQSEERANEIAGTTGGSFEEAAASKEAEAPAEKGVRDAETRSGMAMGALQAIGEATW
jgi:hypothetical protein